MARWLVLTGYMGAGKTSIGRRVANRLDLGGVNYAVDAACASSLAALYAGVRELETGTADAMIVVGADTVQSPFGYLCFAKTRALSPNGRCRAFDESADGNTFYVDSGDGPKQFDASRVDSTIVAGTVEEWTVLNATAELHVFHIHQTDFQVVERNGIPQPFVGHQDNVNVDFQPDGGGPGQVKLIIDFRNPDIVGKFVYHCHIVQHADQGMMANIEVALPGP